MRRGASDKKGKVREIEDLTAMLLWKAEAVSSMKNMMVACNRMVQKHHGGSTSELYLIIRNSRVTLVKTDSACVESRSQALMSSS